MILSLSFFIVTCFAMSFALRSAAIARLILDASLLHCTRERPTLLNFAVPSSWWMRFPLYLLLLCTVFLLNAAVFVDLALCLAVCGLCLGLVELSCSRPLSLKLVCCPLEICNILPGDCAAVCLRSASLHPATEPRSAPGRASVFSGPCCESSSGPSVLTFAFVESLQFSARP